MHKRDKIVLYFPNLYPCTTGGMEIYNSYLYNKLFESSLKERLVVLTGCIDLVDNKNILPLKNRLFFITKYGLGPLSTLIYYAISKKLNWKNIKTVFVPYTSNFENNAIAFLLLRKVFGVNYVVHIHGGGLGYWKTKRLQKAFFSNALNISGVSYSIVNEYNQRTLRDVKYIPPLIPFVESKKTKSDIRTEKGLTDYDLVILFVGSLKPLKAPEILIKAFQGFKPNVTRNQKICLLLVGDGISLPNIKEKYADCCDIRLEGKVPNHEIRDYYKLADIYVIPSWFEGTPISLLEAMFNKLLCIGTDVTGINSIIKHGVTGYLFQKDNVGELTNLLIESICNIDERNLLGQSAHEFFISQYDYGEHINNISTFIENEDCDTSKKRII